MSPSSGPLSPLGRWPLRREDRFQAADWSAFPSKVGPLSSGEQGRTAEPAQPEYDKEMVMSHEQFAFHGEVVPQEAQCPLSDDALNLLPYTFLGLNPDGFILRAEGQTPGGGTFLHRKVIGAQFFSDLFRGPGAEEARARYRAMARSTADDRFVIPVRFVKDGEDRFVELIFTYYASVGLGFVLLREPAKSRPSGG